MKPCRFCGDPSHRCEQINGSCGWLLVAAEVFSAPMLGTLRQQSAACVLLRQAMLKHRGLIVSMTGAS